MTCEKWFSCHSLYILRMNFESFLIISDDISGWCLVVWESKLKRPCSLRSSCVQSDKTQVLSKMIRAILMCLLASALAPDLTRLLEELSQREQGKWGCYSWNIKFRWILLIWSKHSVNFDPNVKRNNHNLNLQL